MTTSDYLKAQADVLIAVHSINRLDLMEMLRTLEIAETEGGGKILDTKGHAVQVDIPVMKKYVEGLIEFRKNMVLRKGRARSLFVTKCIKCGTEIESIERMCTCRCGLKVEMIWPNEKLEVTK